MDLGLRLVMFFSTSEIILIPIYIKNNRIKEKCFTIIIISIYLGGVLFTLLSIKSAIVISYSNALFK